TGSAGDFGSDDTTDPGGASVVDCEANADRASGLNGDGAVAGSARDSRVESDSEECRVERDRRVEDGGNSAAAGRTVAGGCDGASDTTEVPNRENEANFDETVITVQSHDLVEVTANSGDSSGLDNVARLPRGGSEIEVSQTRGSESEAGNSKAEFAKARS